MRAIVSGSVYIIIKIGFTKRYELPYKHGNTICDIVPKSIRTSSSWMLRGCIKTISEKTIAIFVKQKLCALCLL